MNAPEPADSPWTPFRIPAFRALWLAAIASNLLVPVSLWKEIPRRSSVERPWSSIAGESPIRLTMHASLGDRAARTSSWLRDGVKSSSSGLPPLETSGTAPLARSALLLGRRSSPGFGGVLVFMGEKTIVTPAMGSFLSVAARGSFLDRYRPILDPDESDVNDVENSGSSSDFHGAASGRAGG